ncbi:MAG: hypothetical protein IPJ13_24015 [Saprospiraceae bacterium]|nr:hypothetical protein [Saprospiraceae bacterium]
MSLPEPFVVQRKENETFTQASIKSDKPSSTEVVINTQLYGESKLDYNYTGPGSIPPGIQGYIVENSKIIGGRSSQDTFYFSYDSSLPEKIARFKETTEKKSFKSDLSDAWIFGKGDPSISGNEVAMGGAIPFNYWRIKIWRW